MILNAMIPIIYPILIMVCAFVVIGVRESINQLLKITEIKYNFWDWVSLILFELFAIFHILEFLINGYGYLSNIVNYFIDFGIIRI